MVNGYLDCMVKKNREGNPIFPTAAQEDAVIAIKPLISRQECARWKWLEYKLGKLLIAMGRNAEARDVLAPFVLRKSKEAYAWATYGETFLPERPELYAACIFRALQLSKDPKYALSYHEAAIGLFAQMGDYAAARLEAETVSTCRHENGWSQSPVVQRAQQESWYSSSEPSEDNMPKYRALGADAEAALEAYVPKVDFYLEWTAPEKGLAGIDTFRRQSTPWTGRKGCACTMPIFRRTTSLAGSTPHRSTRTDCAYTAMPSHRTTRGWRVCS